MAKKHSIHAQTEEVDIGVLKDHPRNYRVHPEDQIEHIVASIEQHGFYRNIVVTTDGTILAGHGVVQAAKLMGLESVPCVRVDIDPEAPQALKILTGDNGIAQLGGVDDDLLTGLLDDLQQEEGGLLGTGYTDKILSDLLSDAESDSPYSRKIESPVYEPKNKMPAASSLVDVSKRDSLQADITKASLPEDVATFLSMAADRHVVFDFSLIADYYAHAPTEVQVLMEQSALIIIDYDQAIELGYVKLTGAIKSQYAKDHPPEDPGDDE